MCFFPLPNNNYNSIAYKKGLREFDCGKCPECLGKRSSAWALRAVMQARESKNCCMVTLTYDTFKRDEKGNIIGENLNLQSVDKRDCQLFIKRLREYFDRKKGVKDIKYIISAEYGKRTGRPHYHALLFGIKFDDLIFHKKSKRGNKIYISKTLDKLWKNGICTVDASRVSASIAKYCTKYCMKDFGADDTFMLASQNIGLNELLKTFNGRSYWVDGQEYPIPRVVWQQYITKKYALERKKFKYINHKTGEVFYSSPTYKYVNRKKEMYKGIQYQAFIKLKNPFPLLKPYEISVAQIDDIPYMINRKARALYRSYRERDNTYRGYVEYWKNKAEQKQKPSVITRIALLRDKQYHGYKSKARQFMRRHYESGYTAWRERPRFEQKYIKPVVTCRYPPCHITASDRKKEDNPRWVIFDRENVCENSVKNTPILKNVVTQLKIL